MTSPPHVSFSAPENSVVPARRTRIRRRRPARDISSACLTFSMYSSMTPAASADRPARDIRAPGPAIACFCCRDRRCRSRSAWRNSPGAADLRAIACRARRSRRHAAEHVLCVFDADASATYHLRHSLHRWRAFSSLSSIPRRSPRTGLPRDLARRARRPGRGGQAAIVDLKTAAGWISYVAFPGLVTPHGDRGGVEKRVDRCALVLRAEVVLSEQVGRSCRAAEDRSLFDRPVAAPSWSERCPSTCRSGREMAVRRPRPDA